MMADRREKGGQREKEEGEEEKEALRGGLEERRSHVRGSFIERRRDGDKEKIGLKKWTKEESRERRRERTER